MAYEAEIGTADRTPQVLQVAKLDSGPIGTGKGSFRYRKKPVTSFAAGKTGFNIELLEKDYLLTYLLYLIKDVEGIYFKGGTALNKIFLKHARISEDLDFTLTGKLNVVEKNIKEKLKGSIFNKITHDKRVDKFVRNKPFPLILFHNLARGKPFAKAHNGCHQPIPCNFFFVIQFWRICLYAQHKPSLHF